jgi:uncharacterized OB-fold protein
VSAAAKPIAPGLFTDGDDPRLIGSRCEDCGVMTFPVQADCPRCMGEAMVETLFASRGTLWTFTTQEFPPKSPPYAVAETAASFVPFAVGYVEFEDQARVEGRLTEADPSKLRIGMTMETVIVPFTDGVVTYAFRPVAEEEARGE